MEEPIQTISYEGKTIAIIIRDNFKKDGIEFFTPADFPQQLACMTRKKGEIVKAHVHQFQERHISATQEVVFIKKGKVKVDLYDDQKKLLESCVLQTGDVILLASGGHGFEILEDAQMFEIKQGPYIQEKDKTII